MEINVRTIRRSPDFAEQHCTEQTTISREPYLQRVNRMIDYGPVNIIVLSAMTESMKMFKIITINLNCVLRQYKLNQTFT